MCRGMPPCPWDSRGGGPRRVLAGFLWGSPEASGGSQRRGIDSGAAAVLPTVWLIVRRADGRIVGDPGTHGPPDSEGCVEIGYSLAPTARGKGIGAAAVAALVRCLAAVPGICRLTAVTGARYTASRRLLERQGFHITDPLAGADEVRDALSLS